MHRLILLAIAIGALSTSDAIAQRSIPDDNLAYPVLIVVPKGNNSASTASGFYLNSEEFIYLITAKHVLFERGSTKPYGRILEALSYPKDPSDRGRYVLSLDLDILESNRNFASESAEHIDLASWGAWLAGGVSR